MIPDNLEYFIDCNRAADSNTYTAANELSGGLINETADQTKSDDNTWGHSSLDFGTHAGTAGDPYSTGWYANDGSLSYQLTLPAGSHQISFGFYDWWNVTRPTTIYYSYEGQKETRLCSASVPGSNTSVAAGTVELSTKTLVTFTLKSSEGGGPILSWLSAAKILSGTVDSISVKTAPAKTEYFVGEEFSAEGLVINAVYGDSSNRDITEGFTLSDVDMTTPGEKTVTVTYQDKIATFTINVAITAAYVASEITELEAPAKGAEALSLPAVPEGFTIAI